ncbi:HutD family protein [Janthinobacterium sp.]|uniref:HutD/Ves family protein n=1 Tax=Janthinobacterium sp. TaxID=1871054 RepID=UPI00293D6CC1|nr:HutD family protein [Janthinobacterium sp.]
MARLITHAELRAAPWKNGGGSTTEIAASPAGAGFDDFDWRISLATIARSGPFSIFPGIDRSLALVAGEGVALTLDGARRIALSAANPLLWFPGEAQVHAEVAAATTDFNVMTRRSRCRHQLERVTAPAELTRRSPTTLLFLAEGERVGVRGGAQAFTLQRYDALLLDAADAPHWRVDAAAGATLFVVDLIT